MTLLTPNFMLPYPDALNRPCDFDKDWCAFTDAVQVVLDGFQAIADRTYPVVPVARMSVTANVIVGPAQEIPFDTVDVDTAGWIDFDADRSGVYTDRVGRFEIHGNAQISSTVANAFTYLSIKQDADLSLSGFGVDSTLDLAQGVPTGPNVARLVAVTGPTRWALVATVNPNMNLTIERAEFTVSWHADRAAP